MWGSFQTADTPRGTLAAMVTSGEEAEHGRGCRRVDSIPCDPRLPGYVRAACGGALRIRLRQRAGCAVQAAQPHAIDISDDSARARLEAAAWMRVL